MNLFKKYEQKEKEGLQAEPKTHIFESIIFILVMIIICLILILSTTELNLERLKINFDKSLELLTLIVISLTAFFTFMSARAARNSAVSSFASIENMRLGEKRRIKPILAVDFGNVKILNRNIGKAWNPDGDFLELLVLNSNVATNIKVHVSVKNITKEFVIKLSEVDIKVDLDRKHESLAKETIFIESTTLVSWAEVKSTYFESVLSKEINKGRMKVEVPEAFVNLLNSYSLVKSKRIKTPYLEIEIEYSDFEENIYNDTWEVHLESVSGLLGTENRAFFKAIKK